MKTLFIKLILALSLLGLPVWAANDRATKTAKIPKAVQKQMDRLHQTSEIERTDAATELGKMGQKAAPAIPELISLFKDQRQVQWVSERFQSSAMNISRSMPFSVATACSEAISKINDPGAVPLLVKALDTEAWVYALDALEGMGQTALPAASRLAAMLQEDLTIPLWDMKKSLIAKALRQINQQTLVEVLKSGQKPGADYAALELAKAGDQSALPQLMETFKNKELRTYVITALGELQDERAVLPLLDYMQIADGAEKLALIDALGKIGDPRALPQLITFLKDKDSFIRNYAIAALGEIKDPRAVDALLAFLASIPPDDSYYVVQALGAQKDVKATGHLLELLNKEGTSKGVIIMALGELGDRRAVEPLNAFINGKDTNLQMLATEAWGKIISRDFRTDPNNRQKWLKSSGKAKKISWLKRQFMRISFLWHKLTVSMNGILTILFSLGVMIYVIKRIFSR